MSVRRTVNLQPGERYHRLVIRYQVEPPPGREGTYYFCECLGRSLGNAECKGSTVALGSNIRAGIWKSCGCLRQEQARINGKLGGDPGKFKEK